MSVSRNSHVSVCLFSLLCLSYASCCFGFGTFGFDIHHRYSDSVKKILDVDDLPEKGSFRYYSDLVGRDRIIHSRRLATENDQTPVTFLYGNDTYQLSSFGFLHYANVTVGTPGLSFMVALDTGSDLFWLPCDCTSCVRGLNTSSGVVNFNIFSPNTSSTSSKVPCNSTLCEIRCSSPGSNCPYKLRYLDDSTSTGYLVEDVLHLITNDNKSKAVDATISFGCGQVQTGKLLAGGAPNGLFGLGMGKTSVPSILAKQGITSNSFSMCFGPDGIGRISFGDKGSSDQGETPFYLRQLHPTYNITVTQIIVGGNAANLEFSAIFDTGTSFTYLNDPAYTQISESFNSLAKEQRLQTNNTNSSLPFDYCYLLSSNQISIEYPVVNLTMKGGHQFVVNDPIVVVGSAGVANFYCLAVVKSNNVNIIGQNFMTGYHIVFDREKNVLGWKQSDCYGSDNSNTLPIRPPAASPIPATTMNPEAKAGNPNNSPISGAPPPPMENHSPKLRHLSYALAMILIPFLAMI